MDEHAHLGENIIRANNKPYMRNHIRKTIMKRPEFAKNLERNLRKRKRAPQK